MARILIADDVLPIRLLLRHVLLIDRHQVFEAATGDEAIDLLHREHPDIAILDVFMPGLTGFDVCKVTRADPCLSAIGLILLSGSMSATAVHAAGADYGFSKPFSPTELRNAVTTLLHAPGFLQMPAAARPDDTAQVLTAKLRPTAACTATRDAHGLTVVSSERRG
jgi:CheY-like chemotaxis protein